MKIDKTPTGNVRIECLAPARYRLASKPSGGIVLQGEFQWSSDDGMSGAEWRDLPTVALPE
jgi:hypothetical protein